MVQSELPDFPRNDQEEVYQMRKAQSVLYKQLEAIHGPRTVRNPSSTVLACAHQSFGLLLIQAFHVLAISLGKQIVFS